MGSANYERGARLERRTAKLLSELTKQEFKRVPGSGRYSGMPGDVDGPHDLIQNKLSSEKSNTGEKSIRIKKEDLVKIVKQAKSKDKEPALIFAFNGDHQLWSIITLERYAQLIERESHDTQ